MLVVGRRRYNCPMKPAAVFTFPTHNFNLIMFSGANSSFRVTGSDDGKTTDYTLTLDEKGNEEIQGTFAGEPIDVHGERSGNEVSFKSRSGVDVDEKFVFDDRGIDDTANIGGVKLKQKFFWMPEAGEPVQSGELNGVPFSKTWSWRSPDSMTQGGEGSLEGDRKEGLAWAVAYSGSNSEPGKVLMHIVESNAGVKSDETVTVLKTLTGGLQ